MGPSFSSRSILASMPRGLFSGAGPLRSWQSSWPRLLVRPRRGTERTCVLPTFEECDNEAGARVATARIEGSAPGNCTDRGRFAWQPRRSWERASQIALRKVLFEIPRIKKGTGSEPLLLTPFLRLPFLSPSSFHSRALAPLRPAAHPLSQPFQHTPHPQKMPRAGSSRRDTSSADSVLPKSRIVNEEGAEKVRKLMVPAGQWEVSVVTPASLPPFARRPG